MNAYVERILSSQEFEQRTKARLEQDYECEVGEFGQGQLPERLRNYLKCYLSKPNIRWLPDLLVARIKGLPNGKLGMWLVDAKSCRLDTDYWDIEQASLAAHRAIRYQLGLPIIYVWPDGCSYMEDLRDDLLVHGPYRGNGSGTPFWLFPKKYTRTLEDVFGKKAETTSSEEPAW